MRFFDKLKDGQKIDFLHDRVGALEGEVSALKEEAKGSLKVAGIHKKIMATAALLAALSMFGSFWANVKQSAAETERKDRLMWQLEKKYGNGESYHD